MGEWTNEPRDELVQFFGGAVGRGDGPVEVRTQPLRGGIDSAGVARVAVCYRDARGKRATRAFVWKRLAGVQAREARVYGEILPQAGNGVAPTLAQVGGCGGECWLLLEAIRPAMSWPWRDTESTAGVLRALARLHESVNDHATAPAWLDEWDYECEIAGRATQLVQALEATRGGEARRLRASVPAVQRLATSVGEWRRQLLEFQPLGRTFIHGDVHPGNVMVRRSRGRLAPVLIDWGRSRVGSPLEDVSSWLQSLRYWEPVARQRHDSLLAAYLRARGLPERLGRDLRDAYWLAAASNLLAGAILFHLARASDLTIPEGNRAAAVAAAADGLRVIRRADACWSDVRGRRGRAGASGRRT